MISLLGTRPAIQVGRRQILDYDTAWLATALRRAAAAAGREDFPFVEEIRTGIEVYLETKCPLKLLPLEELFARLRHMLERIGCEAIAAKLEAEAPPVTVSLAHTALEAGHGYELAFFARLQEELRELRAAGAREVRFTGLRESVMVLSRAPKWNLHCDALLADIRQFLVALDLGRVEDRDGAGRSLFPGGRPGLGRQ